MEKLLKIREWLQDNSRVLKFLAVIFLSAYGAWKIFGWLFIWTVLLYGAYYVYKHRGELARTKLEDWINPVKWGSVLFAMFTKMLFPMHIMHQLVLRMFDKECSKCMANGSCFHCGCDMSKVYVPWEVCSRGFWWRMYENAKKYWKLREEWPVEISIRYPREEAMKGVGQGPEFEMFFRPDNNSSKGYWIALPVGAEGQFDNLPELLQMGAVRRIAK